MEIFLQIFHTDVTDVYPFKNFFTLTVFFFFFLLKLAFYTLQYLLMYLHLFLLNFFLVLYLLDYFSIFFLQFSFFHFVASYLLLTFLYSQLLYYILFRVYLLVLHPSGLFNFPSKFVARFLSAVLFLFLSSGSSSTYSFSRLLSV